MASAKSKFLNYALLGAGAFGLFLAHKKGALNPVLPASMDQTLIPTAPVQTPIILSPAIYPTAPAPLPAISTPQGPVTPSNFNPCPPGTAMDVCECLKRKASSGWSASTCITRLGQISAKFNGTRTALAQIQGLSNNDKEKAAKAEQWGNYSIILRNTIDSLQTLLGYEYWNTGQKQAFSAGIAAAAARKSMVDSGGYKAKDHPTEYYVDYQAYLSAERDNAVGEYFKLTGMIPGNSPISAPAYVPPVVQAPTNIEPSGGGSSSASVNPSDVARVKAVFTSFSDPTSPMYGNDNAAQTIADQYRAGQLDPNSGAYQALKAAGV